jgi:hypothetical protein
LIILEFITDENRKLVWEDLKQEMKQLTEKKQTILFPCNSISSLSQIEELRKFFEKKTTNMNLMEWWKNFCNQEFFFFFNFFLINLKLMLFQFCRTILSLKYLNL